MKKNYQLSINNIIIKKLSTYKIYDIKNWFKMKAFI